MPKVTVRGTAAAAAAAKADTPSEELVRQALREEVIPDDRGRKLTMRKPGVLAQYRLVEALGPLSANQAYMSMVNPLLYLAAIDGENVLQPKSKLEVEALIQRLDEEGLATVMVWYLTNVIGPTNEVFDAAAKAAADKAAVKN